MINAHKFLPNNHESGIERKELKKYKSKTPARKQKTYVRKYHHTLLAPVTGKVRPKTAEFRNEPEGRYKCGDCDAVFTHTRSLQFHLSRKHNPKATIPCPENCGKMLASQNSIPKHLLSHRPKSQWPYFCPLCKKHFQALADVPKHFKTSQHINDPRIPELGTPEWDELMKSCKI